jgi:hypothetical protein
VLAMSSDKKTEPDFNAAADRRAYEKERLPADLKEVLNKIKNDFEQKKAKLSDQQKKSYTEEVEKEKIRTPKAYLSQN